MKKSLKLEKYELSRHSKFCHILNINNKERDLLVL